MVGSKRWFRYVSDGLGNFAINLDESNTEATNTGGATSASPPAAGLPRNIEPRYGLFRSLDTFTQRKVVYLDPESFNLAGPGDTFTPQGTTTAVFLSYKRGEAQRVARTDDTGLTDGDNP